MNVLNDMEKKDGRMRNHNTAIDLQYMARTNRTHMPSFMRVQPPSQDLSQLPSPHIPADLVPTTDGIGGEFAKCNLPPIPTTQASSVQRGSFGSSLPPWVPTRPLYLYRILFLASVSHFKYRIFFLFSLPVL